MANLSNINDKFLVTTGGNVLIGQTSAVGSSILQVTGNSTFAGTGSFANNLDATKSQNTATSITVSNINAGSSQQARFVAIADSGNIQIKAISTANTTYGVGDVGVINCDTMSNGLKFAHNDQVKYTLAFNGENTWTGGGTFGGNIGIGFAVQSNIRTFVYDNSSNYSLAVQQDGSGIPFQVTSGGNVRMIVANNGNVGIGVTPSYKLDVGGMADPSVRIKSDAGGDPILIFDAAQANRSARIKFYDNGSTVGGFIDYVHNGDKMNFGAGSSSGVTMTVGDGEVGFGQTSPQFNVHSGTTVAIPNSRYLNFAGTGTNEIAYNNFKKALVFSANDSTATSQPQSIGIILHNESTTDNNFTPLLAFGAQSNSTNYSQVVAGIAGKRLETAGDSNWSGGELWFWTARDGTTFEGSTSGLPETPVMVMDTSRNVGIGTTTPSYGKLQVDQTSGNNLTLRKGTGQPAIAFGGVTNNEAVCLVEGNGASGGLKFYNGTGTLASPTWSAGMEFFDSGRLYPYGGVYLGSSNNSNLLDDYEEGTWTPVAYASSGTATGSYSEQLGTYTKTGRQVICMFDITLTLSGTMVGFAGISGLPFTVGTSSATGGGMAGYSVNQFRSSSLFAVAGADRQISGFPQQNASYIYCQLDNSGVNGFGSAAQATWNIGTSGRCTGYVIYFTN